LGFAGDIKACFRSLDADKKGTVTLQDIDPDAHGVLNEFRTLLLEKYGSYINGWKAMDTNGNGTLELDEMDASCKIIGYSRSPGKLFKYLLDNPGCRSITMGDIDPAAMQAYYRGDLMAMSPMEKAKAQLKARQAADEKEKTLRMEAADWATLKKSLIRKFGTITSAWRMCLDKNGNGKVSFTDFTKAIRDFGFQGNIRKVFKELDDDNSGIITFNEIDPEWYGRLSQFHSDITNMYTCYEDLWKELDTGAKNTVDVEDFVPWCEKIGYQGNSKALYKQLLMNKNKITLSLEDLEAKDKIIQANKADETSTRKLHRLKTDTLSSQDLAKFYVASRDAAQKAAQGMKMGADTWESFRNQLIRQYGTITAAWRHGLDAKGNGKLSYIEFCKCCQNHAFEGNIKKCFQELDDDGSGVLTFNEIDPEWFEKHSLFRDLLLAKYETYDKAWDALDDNKNRMLEVDEFEDVCKKVGYTHNSKALFKQLLLDQSKRYLNPEDIHVGKLLVTKAEISFMSPTSTMQSTINRTMTGGVSLKKGKTGPLSPGSGSNASP
jgi:Ca2+-binding EF-hand superfamily protein